ncbi:MAG: hypothetical protein D6730_17520 [Bacteroidetes bacterium]|nr:MAG: hypothetical protein D6730_17520 [Bacteroidota bacterium]
MITSFLYFPLIQGLNPGNLCVLVLLNFVHVGVLYALASRFQQQARGEWFRGGMVGLNAGLNGLLIEAILRQWVPAVGLSLLVALGASLYVSRSSLYHRFIGWANWLLPMSWLINALGLIFVGINLALAPLGYCSERFRALRVYLRFEPHTCTFIMTGGAIRALPAFKGFNMGNFVFLKPGSEYLLRHEIGHLLSLAAMGAAFHLIGGIDESLIQLRYWEAYAEYLADSYNQPTRSVLSMWR